MSKFASAAAACIAGPPLLLAGIVVLVVGVPSVREVFWPTPDANPAEAAVLDDLARLRLLANTGGEFRAGVPVRPGLLTSEPTLVTPLEAAIAAGHADAFSLLLELGAVPAPSEAARLRCLAQASGQTAIVDRLGPLADLAIPCG